MVRIEMLLLAREVGPRKNPAMILGEKFVKNTEKKIIGHRLKDHQIRKENEKFI